MRDTNSESDGTEQPFCKSVCDGGHYMCELRANHDGPHRVHYNEMADYIWTDTNPVARPEVTHQGGNTNE